MTDHEQFIRDTYDSVILDSGEDGMKIGEATAHVADVFAAAIQRGDVDGISVDAYAERMTAQVIGRSRSGRRNSLVKEAEYIAAVLAGETILEAEDHPLLKLAYPGSRDGIDKALIYWTEDDWRNATMTRYRKAAEATAAAVAFDEVASVIIGLLKGKATGDALGLA